jgi:hypothetical protein
MSYGLTPAISTTRLLFVEQTGPVQSPRIPQLKQDDRFVPHPQRTHWQAAHALLLRCLPAYNIATLDEYIGELHASPSTVRHFFETCTCAVGRDSEGLASMGIALQ